MAYDRLKIDDDDDDDVFHILPIATPAYPHFTKCQLYGIIMKTNPFSRFDRILACDRQTDIQTQGHS